LLVQGKTNGFIDESLRTKAVSCHPQVCQQHLALAFQRHPDWTQCWNLAIAVIAQ